MKKQIIYFIIACMLSMTACSSLPIEKFPVATDVAMGDFTVEFLDVGKADAMILKTENMVTLIDCATSKKGDDIADYFHSKGITTVDYLIITHYDQDHVGGAPKIIKELDVKNIICPDYVGNNKEYEKFVKALNKNNITATYVKDKMSINMDDVSFDIYPPEKDYYVESDNDFSLAIFATHGKNTYLFAGDAEGERISEIMQYGNLKSTVLKVPHHGRENVNTVQFINAVQPEYAVISSDFETTELNVVNALDNTGAKTYCTFDGSVVFTSNGKNITVTDGEF